MATGDRIYLADKETLDRVESKLNRSGTLVGEAITSVGMALPYNFYQGCAVVLNDEIHLLGGAESQTYHYKFDGVKWVSVSTLPYTFVNGSAIVINNEIHILGGNPFGFASISHYKFNGYQWSSVSTLPYTFYGGYAIMFQSQLHILGGGETGKGFYRFTGVSWELAGTVPYVTANGAALVVNDILHVLGGSMNISIYYTYDGTNWVKETSLGFTVASSGVVSLNDEIHVMGASTSSNTSKKAYSKVTSSKKSILNLPTLPLAFESGCAVVFNDSIYLLGGIDNPRTVYRSNDVAWESVGERVVGMKYYLQTGTKILCNRNNTKISKGVKNIDGGYEVTDTGIIRIDYNNSAGKCYIIV